MPFSHYFLIFILLGWVPFIACDEAQMIMKPVLPPELSAPGIRIEIPPTEIGTPGHGFGNRSVYINGIGVAALKDDTLEAFPIGTLITKEVNNDTNAFVQHVAIMSKTDDAAYAAHNGWRYTLHTRESETAKFIGVGGDVPGSTSDSCHACHTQAPKDSVFMQLPAPEPEVETQPRSETESTPEPEVETQPRSEPEPNVDDQLDLPRPPIFPDGPDD